MQTKEVQAGSSSSGCYKVDEVSNKKSYEKNSNGNKNFDKNTKLQETVANCTYCRYTHKKGGCPAFGKVCLNCNKLNHFSKCCKTKNVKTLREVQEHEQNLFIDTIITVNKSVKVTNQNVKIGKIDSVGENGWFKDLKIEDQTVNFKLDTGAEVNVISKELFEKLNNNFKVRKTDVILEAYGGFKINPIGQVCLSCQYKGKYILMDFLITPNGLRPILGFQACMTLGILKRTDVLEVSSKEEFIKNNVIVFSGLGKLKSDQKLEVRDGISPVAKPPRRIAVNLRKKVQEKLDELEKEDIIEAVMEPAEWVHNMVVVEKENKKLRICLDPHVLNEALKRNYVLTLEDMSETLAGAEYYSVLDLKDGFYQIELEKESSKLCTFSTPYGCYMFKRLPFGVSIGPELCQKYNQDLFGGIAGVVVYMDDILITGKTLKEHDETLEKVMNVAKENNVKFNEKKFQYRLKEIKYLGHIFSKNGMEIDPERVKAIEKMEDPKNIKELRRFLGMVNHLRGFIEGLSELTAPLRDLLKANVHYEWLPVHSNVVKKLKEKITRAPILQIFDSSKRSVIQSDASKDGIGYWLTQEKKPVVYGSRCMTPAEQNYAQVEKEFLVEMNYMWKMIWCF